MMGISEAHLLNTQEMLEEFAGLKEDEHGADTPKRFLSMLDELTACKDCDTSCIKWKDFRTEAHDMIVVKRIPFSSLCNHHVVPFTGYAYIGYVPDALMAGLSKFARVVHHFARRLNVQERLTWQIGDYLQRQLHPQGLAIVLEAEHLCMTIRGVQAPGTTTQTASMTGCFADHNKTAKTEFLTYLNGSHK